MYLRVGLWQRGHDELHCRGGALPLPPHTPHTPHTPHPAGPPQDIICAVGVGRSYDFMGSKEPPPISRLFMDLLVRLPTKGLISRLITA